jgi:hypothetical protein
MKNILGLIVMALLLFACGSDSNKNAETGKDVIKEKQLNISILLDLSDRINPEINPSAKERDITNIKTITEYFTENMQRLNAYNAKGKIRLFLIPPPANADINSIVSKLNIDCSKMDNSGRKEIYDNLTSLYSEQIENIYNETIQTSEWLGSDIWRFFNNDVKDYCVDSDSSYRNLLIILTDGYLFHEHSQYDRGNRYTYLLNRNLSQYRNQNWRRLVEERDFGIISEREDLNDLEVMVLEIKAENPANSFDEDILTYVWKKWLGEMNVKHYEVYHSDLPANTKTRINKFLKSL